MSNLKKSFSREAAAVFLAQKRKELSVSVAVVGLCL